LGVAKVSYAATGMPNGQHYTFNTVTEKTNVVFQDTFDGNLLQWSNVSGTEAIVDYSGNNVYQRTDGSYVGAVDALAGSENWSDYTFSFDVTKVSGSYFNVVFRYVDGNNYYLLEPSSDQVHIALFKKVGGAFTELGRPLQDTTPGVTYHYVIDLNGSSIKIWVDGVLKFNVTDSSFSAGKIGVGAYYGSVANFDNILVKTIGEGEILVPLIGNGYLGWTVGPEFKITDNNMLDDGHAWVQVPAGFYSTWDQARGTPGGSLYWGNTQNRLIGKPVWIAHNGAGIDWNSGWIGNNDWPFSNNGVTNYSFRLYPVTP